MRQSLKFFVVLVAIIALSACKIVIEDGSTGKTDAGVSGDNDRIAALIDKTFDAQLFPEIKTKAQDFETFRKAIAADIDKAGQRFGHRGAGQGAAWNFSIKGTGTIVDGKLDSRARTFSVDMDDDANADLLIQLGPVVKGTALRDFASFYNFNDFRDQIEFAKLGRALNDRATASIEVDGSGYIGNQIEFVGVLTLSSSTTRILVTPITLQVAP